MPPNARDKHRPSYTLLCVTPTECCPAGRDWEERRGEGMGGSGAGADPSDSPAPSPLAAQWTPRADHKLALLIVPPLD